MTLLTQATEAQFQQLVIDYAHTMGWLCHHVKPARTPDGRYLTRIAGDAGFPDLVCARRGRVVFLELKSEKGRVRPEQSAWLEALGGMVARPSDWPKIMDLLR